MISSVLFFLIQFFSILVLVVSNVGFFYSHFTATSCQRFYYWPSVFKVIQAMVSQAILGVRAFNLSRRSTRIGLLLAGLFISACALEWVTNFYGRIPFYDLNWGNCRNIPQVGLLGSWIYYAIAIIYDLATSAISITYLLKHHLSSSSSGLMSRLTKMMLYDGLGYFFALTVINAVNLIVYHSNESIRTAACSLGYCLTWIMSQRLLMHLHNASRERRNESINQAVTITQSIESARQISKAMRAQFEPKTGLAIQLTVPDFDLDTMDSDGELPDDVGVEVRIERTFELHHRSGRYELEDYSRSARSLDTTHSRSFSRT